MDTGRIERVLKGHTNVIFALAFAPDGRRLASGSFDKTARVWDVASGRCEQVLQGHTNSIYGVAFAPDGRRLATASYDTTGRIWSVTDGRCEQVLRGHAKEVRCVAWSPDGKVVATGSSRSIHPAVETRRYVHPDLRWPGEPDCLPDLHRRLPRAAVHMGRRKKNIRGSALLDLTTGRERVRFAQHNNTVMAGALSPDGTLAATGDFLGETYLWKTSDATPVHRLAGKGPRTGVPPGARTAGLSPGATRTTRAIP